MSKRSVIVRKGLTYRRKTQVRTSLGHLPRLSGALVVSAGKKTAFRNVRTIRRDYYKEKVWKFKLYRDDDTTIRYLVDEGEHKKGDIREASGTLIDLALLDYIEIVAGGERVSIHEGNYKIENEDGTYTLKNKKGENFVFGDYWTLFEGVWYYDDSGGYPYKPGTGLFNPATGSYTIQTWEWKEWPGGLPGKNGWGAAYWVFNEEDGIWYYDDSEEWPDDFWSGSYNPNTGYYTIDQNRNVGTAKVISPAVTVPDDTKFWVECGCNIDYSLEIIYPYRYKKVDAYEMEDKISKGTYKDNLPYWEKLGGYSEPEKAYPPNQYCTEFSGYAWMPGVGNVFKTYYTLLSGLKTSIPYKAKYTLRSGNYQAGGFALGTLELCSEELTCRANHIQPFLIQSDAIRYTSEDEILDILDSELTSEQIKYYSDSWINPPTSIETEVEISATVTNSKFSDYTYRCLIWDEDEEEWKTVKKAATMDWLHIHTDGLSPPGFIYE